MPTLTPTEPTLVSTTDMPDTPMPIMACTTARGPLRLSQRLMLMLTTMVPTDWVTMVWATDTDMPDTPTPIVPTTMATTVMVPGPTTGTDWDTVATEDTTGDKFSA